MLGNHSARWMRGTQRTKLGRHQHGARCMMSGSEAVEEDHAD
jgi:hypothetical protein